MQETRPYNLNEDESREIGKLRREFFQGSDNKELTKIMDARLDALSKRDPPEVLVRRVKVGRNDPCPCGSGSKAKKCCMITGRIDRR